MRNTEIILTLALTLCHLVATAPAHAGAMVDVQGKGGEVTPSPDHATVVFVRPAFTGPAVKFWAFVDESAVGATKGKTYVETTVTPGEHLFWSKAENVDALSLTVEAGEVYYIKQNPRMGGLKARVALQLLDTAAGQKAFRKCKRAELTAEGRTRGAELAAKHLAKARNKAE